MKKFFKLKENNVTFKSEALAALTSFFAAVYIIIVNSSILNEAGPSVESLIIATVFASVAGCLLSAFISNAPLVIMPGMGINALFTYTVVITLGLDFYQGLAAVFISGVLFTIIALTPLSDILFSTIPHNLKEAINVGIGLFITFLGFQKAGIIVSDPSNFVKMGNITDINVLVFIISMLIAVILFLKNIRGGFLISIIVGTIIAIFFGTVDISNLQYSLPDFSEYGNIFYKLDFSSIMSVNFWIAVFSMTLVLVFENIGIIHSQVSSMLNRPEDTKKSLASVSLSTIVYSFLGCSPPVSTVEGCAGISDGGKTGLTSILVSGLFLISLFFIPFISLIPNTALAPVLIILGCLMIQGLKNINFDDLSELFPSFITITAIPLTSSIVDGIAFGFILYPICKICCKKRDEISIPMYIISLIFFIYFVLQAFMH